MEADLNSSRGIAMVMQQLVSGLYFVIREKLLMSQTSCLLSKSLGVSYLAVVALHFRVFPTRSCSVLS